MRTDGAKIRTVKKRHPRAPVIGRGGYVILPGRPPAAAARRERVYGETVTGT